MSGWWCCTGDFGDHDTECVKRQIAAATAALTAELAAAKAQIAGLRSDAADQGHRSNQQKMLNDLHQANARYRRRIKTLRAEIIGELIRMCYINAQVDGQEVITIEDLQKLGGQKWVSPPNWDTAVGQVAAILEGTHAAD